MSHAETSAHTHEHANAELPHDHDFAAANQKHFDAEAKAFDAKPSAQEMARRVSKAMINTYPSLFDEESTTLLDFACGSGETWTQLSRNFAEMFQGYFLANYARMSSPLWAWI